jgi:hypothetical protein
MTTRTFKQLGQAYGSQTASITAKINNVVVYQGEVTTLNESFPALPNLEITVNNELFTWTADVDFSGSQTMEISIDGNASLLVTELNANYTPIQNTGNVGNVGNIISSGPNGYVGFAYGQFGNTYIDSNLVPSSSIDHDTLSGPWWFTVPPSGTFIENYTIEPGLE